MTDEKTGGAMQKKPWQGLRLSLQIYMLGIVLMTGFNLWSAIQNGALDRQHDDWLQIIGFYGLTALAWPVVLIGGTLVFFGAIRSPICCG